MADEPADFDQEEIVDEGDNDFEPVFETVEPSETQQGEKKVGYITLKLSLLTALELSLFAVLIYGSHGDINFNWILISL